MIILRYLVRELSGTFFAVTTVLLMIILSGRLIKTMAAAAAGEVSVEFILLALLYRLPYFLDIIIPLALYMSILIGYGRLYAESEMTVLTATGFSDRKLLAYSMIPALFMMLMVALSSMYLSPLGAQKTEDLYVEEAKRTEFELLAPGRFQSALKGSRVTYTESLSSDKQQMNHVFIADGDSLIVAERGTQYVSPETGSRFLELHEGRRYDLTPGSAELQVLDFERYGVRMSQEQAERRQLRKEALATLDLIGSDNPLYVAQLHWRISLILLVPIGTLMAFPLSRVNPRQGRFARMFPALMLFMVYVSMLAGLVGLVEKGRVSPYLSLWLVHLLFLLIALTIFLWPSYKRWRYVRRISA
ncbi:LPS export ABC transporter permease LptF [Venatoribacter cucullus]|uniref:LPS export ABC transporter permease LptF n=1 Tax=Venatoribacter cucullus TaxID=2661630 RepID=UPI001E4D7784|nr:LPS export ABC transporter permease LptF [Venatoribacter cucullus]